MQQFVVYYTLYTIHCCPKFLASHFQIPLLSLAQNLNAYQVPGPSISILPHPQKLQDALLRPFLEVSKGPIELLGMW